MRYSHCHSEEILRHCLSFRGDFRNRLSFGGDSYLFREDQDIVIERRFLDIAIHRIFINCHLMEIWTLFVIWRRFEHCNLETIQILATVVNRRWPCL